ncbi:MAG: homogentisate 1,2-dioxygenase [Actinomycetota bacterium]
MRYHRLGDVPRKRHVQHREDGALLTEEVMGYEGFSGNESILYHLVSPCRVAEVGPFTPLIRGEWVPDAHVHRLAHTAALPRDGDALTGRRLLMWNDDVEVSLCRPVTGGDAFYRNGEGDEVVFVHEGSGTLATVFGRVAFGPHDYLVIPRGTTHRFELDDGPHTWVVLATPGEVETPGRYRNRYGQLVEGAPFSHRDFRPPAELETHREEGEFHLVVRVRGGLQRFLLDRHPFDVVGWDGYVYPYAFNVHDFEPLTGRIHLPPPVHQTFQGPNFVICSFVPRELDYDPQAVPIPYHHSNLQSEEVIYYVSGEFGSRRGIEEGSVTLHPSGLPHGPQPGLVERSLGARRTEELAVMWDTFRPLRLAELWRDLDDPSYALSWSAAAEAPAAP